MDQRIASAYQSLADRLQSTIDASAKETTNFKEAREHYDKALQRLWKTKAEAEYADTPLCCLAADQLIFAIFQGL